MNDDKASWMAGPMTNAKDLSIATRYPSLMRTFPATDFPKVSVLGLASLRTHVWNYTVKSH
jgi:hypothetical protein